MDTDEVRLEPVETDYEAQKGNEYGNLADSFEPLEVRCWYPCVRHVY